MPSSLAPAITPLHPTFTQSAQLTALFHDADTVHFTVRRWLRAVGTGSLLSVHEAFSQAALGQPLPEVDDACTVELRPEHLAQLNAVQASDLPGRWSTTVPAQTLSTLLRIEVVRLARFGARSIAGEAFPLRPLARIPLDDAAQPLDAHHVMIECVDHHVIADLWALPSDLTLALRQQAHDRLRALHWQWDDLHSRLVSGQPFRAPEALQLGMQAGYRDCPPVLTVDPEKPTRAKHVSLVQGIDVTGAPIWQLEWSIRIPQGYLPDASINDTVGIDVGYRRLATAASGTGHWFLDRRTDVREGLPSPCQHDPLQLLAHAQTRRLLLDLHRPEIEAFVVRALQYHRVHLERINWQNFQTHGNAPWSAVAMDLIGTPRIAEWVRLFAPVTHSDVKLVDPDWTSQTCHRCQRTGVRPRPYKEFQCAVCGPCDPDINSAYVIRSA